nr:hypothetical protein [Pseudomonadota bacterium]
SRNAADAGAGMDCNARRAAICAETDDPFATLCGTNESAQNNYCRSDSRNAADAGAGMDCNARRAAICAETDDPFATLCGTNESAQNNYCRSDSRNAADAGAGMDCQGRRAAICAETDDPFATLCGVNESAQNNYCISSSRSPADANAGEDCQPRRAAICATNGGTSPFSALCGLSNQASQQTFCITNRDHMGTTGNCPATITTFCVAGTDNIFNALCTDTAKTYDTLRGTRCATFPKGDTRRDTYSCGTEGTPDSYFAAYCAPVGNGGSAAALTNHRDCPSAYNGANQLASGDKVTVTNVLGAMGTNALNSDGTARLTNSLRDGTSANVFLPAPNAFSNHRAANFMVGHLNNLGPLHNGLNTNTLTLD